jgi:hypothetical protein
MRRINQTIKDHWLKLALVILTAACVVVTKAGEALGERIASAITGDRITVVKISAECRKRDSLILVSHNADVEKIVQSLEETKKTNTELMRKVDIYGAKMDGYFEAQHRRDYSGAEAKKDTTKPCGNIAYGSESN